MIKPTGLLNHSAHTAKKSEHYHAKVIGQPEPFNAGGLNVTKTRDPKARERIRADREQEKMQSTRPGLTAQRGLGG